MSPYTPVLKRSREVLFQYSTRNLPKLTAEGENWDSQNSNVTRQKGKPCPKLQPFQPSLLF